MLAWVVEYACFHSVGTVKSSAGIHLQRKVLWVKFWVMNIWQGLNTNLQWENRPLLLEHFQWFFIWSLSGQEYLSSPYTCEISHLPVCPLFYDQGVNYAWKTGQSFKHQAIHKLDTETTLIHKKKEKKWWKITDLSCNGQWTQIKCQTLNPWLFISCT